MAQYPHTCKKKQLLNFYLSFSQQGGNHCEQCVSTKNARVVSLSIAKYQQITEKLLITCKHTVVECAAIFVSTEIMFKFKKMFTKVKKVFK